MAQNAVLCELPAFHQPYVHLYCGVEHLICSNSVMAVTAYVLSRADRCVYCEQCKGNASVHPMTVEHLSRIHRYAAPGSIWRVEVTTGRVSQTTNSPIPVADTPTSRAALTPAEEHEILYRASDIRVHYAMMRYIEERVHRSLRSGYDGTIIYKSHLLEEVAECKGWLTGSAWRTFRGNCITEWDGRGFHAELCEKPSLADEQDRVITLTRRVHGQAVGQTYSLDDGTDT